MSEERVGASASKLRSGGEGSTGVRASPSQGRASLQGDRRGDVENGQERVPEGHEEAADPVVLYAPAVDGEMVSGASTANVSEGSHSVR